MGRLLEWLVMSVLRRAFPNRYRLVPGLHGKPLLRQFKVTNWAYLQSFLNPEGEDLFHVHRWEKMISFVLSGSFTEERYPGGDQRFFKTHKAPQLYTMDKTTIHRLHSVEPRTWTLFLMLWNQKAWGYYPRPENLNFISWEKAIPETKRVEAL